MQALVTHRLLVCVSCIALLTTGSALAQSPADDFVRTQAQKLEADRLDALRKSTPDDSAVPAGPPAEKSGAGGPCIAIKRVEVEGVRQFTASSIASLTAPFQGKCVGVAQINNLLRSLTYLYLDKGFVTSRAFVPEQNIAETKVLRLIVVEGGLSAIYLNGVAAPYSGMLATAFPGMQGKIANIRDIEQGLDQINRLASNHAKSSMLPGKDDGTSILNVENRPGLPLHVSLSNSNLGQKSTGYAQSNASFSADNLFGLNDALAFTYTRTGPDYPWTDNDGVGHSNSYSGTISIPYGYWSLSANGSSYDYESTVPGNFSPIETSGSSAQAGVGLDRVIWRDKDSITTLNAALTYKQTDNFLLGNRIETGSRQYTVGSLGLSHSRRMAGASWVFDVGYNQGLDLFGAVEAGEPGAGDADPHFAKFTTTINVVRPFEFEKLHFDVASIISGQFSPDNLFGAEQIALGGSSNVRGTRDSVLYGNDGFFSRNELGLRLMPWRDHAVLARAIGEFRPYAGLDYGHVFAQERYDIDAGDIASWTVGARLGGGTLTVDAGYSDIFASSVDHFDSGLFFFSTSVRW